MLVYFILFYSILFYFILFYLILSYFISFYFIYHFILSLFILIISSISNLEHLRYFRIKFCLQTYKQTDTQARLKNGFATKDQINADGESDKDSAGDWIEAHLVNLSEKWRNVSPNRIYDHYCTDTSSLQGAINTGLVNNILQI